MVSTHLKTTHEKLENPFDVLLEQKDEEAKKKKTAESHKVGPRIQL